MICQCAERCVGRGQSLTSFLKCPCHCALQVMAAMHRVCGRLQSVRYAQPLLANPSQPSLARPLRAGMVCFVDRRCGGIAAGQSPSNGTDLLGLRCHQVAGQDGRWYPRGHCPYAGLSLVRPCQRSPAGFARRCAFGPAPGARVAPHPCRAHCCAHSRAAAAAWSPYILLIATCFIASGAL